jgi:hypothetical protein
MTNKKGRSLLPRKNKKEKKRKKKQNKTKKKSLKFGLESGGAGSKKTDTKRHPEKHRPLPPYFNRQHFGATLEKNSQWMIFFWGFFQKSPSCLFIYKKKKKKKKKNRIRLSALWHTNLSRAFLHLCRPLLKNPSLDHLKGTHNFCEPSSFESRTGSEKRMEAALAPPEVPPLALGLLDECDGLAAGLLGAALGSGWVTLGSVWQCVAVCVAVCGSVRQCVWQCVWQCAAVCGSVWQTFFNGASFLFS